MTDPYNNGQLDPQTRNSAEKLSNKNEPLARNTFIDDPAELKDAILCQVADEVEVYERISTEKVEFLNLVENVVRHEIDFDTLCSIRIDEEYLNIHSMPKALYELLLSVLDVQNITAIPDLLGNYAGFKLYSSKALKQVKGLKVPGRFLLLDYFPTRLQNKMAKQLKLGIYAYLKFGEYRLSIAGKFKSLVKPWTIFIDPLVNPKVNYRTTSLFGQIERELSSQRIPNNEDERIAANVKDFPHQLDQGRIAHPLKVVPADSWFPDSIKELKPEHIVTIFQPNELLVFMLLIGRALVGSDGNSPCGYPDYQINHTARIAAILKGVPGTGKSTLLNLVAKSMETYGYSAKPFRSLEDRFGMGEIAEANFAYRDDTSMADLEAITKSSTFKSYVTGGKICSEKKHKDQTYTNARGVIILAANNWNPTQSYNTDDGNRSRLRLLETMESAVRDKKLIGIESDHPWQGLDTLEPSEVVEHLCKKYDVDEAVLMGWFFRQCADYFYESIPHLESIDRNLESKLSTRIAAPLTKPLTKALKLVLRLMGRKSQDALTRENLKEALFGLNRILKDCRSTDFLSELKRQWESTYRAQEHCWVCFRDVRYESIESAMEASDFAASAGFNPTGSNTLDDYIKKTLAVVYTRGGIAAGNSPSNFLAAWESPDTLTEVEALHGAVKGHLPDNFFAEKDGLESECRTWFNPAMQPKAITKRRLLAHKFFKESIEPELGK